MNKKVSYLFVFFSVTKLLLAAGYNQQWAASRDGKRVTLLDLKNPSKSCNLQKFPYPLNRAVGGFTSVGPMVCGGLYENYDVWNNPDVTRTFCDECYGLQPNGQFVELDLALDNARVGGSTIVTKDGNLILSGGYFDDGGLYYDRWSRLENSEILKVQEGTTENGFNLPAEFPVTCSTRINTTTAILLGRKSTFFVNLDTLQVSNGPEMVEESRFNFGCAVFEHNQHTFVIATNDMNSTEVLDLDASPLNWSRGKTTKPSSLNIDPTQLWYHYRTTFTKKSAQ